MEGRGGAKPKELSGSSSGHKLLEWCCTVGNSVVTVTVTVTWPLPQEEVRLVCTWCLSLRSSNPLPGPLTHDEALQGKGCLEQGDDGSRAVPHWTVQSGQYPKEPEVHTRPPLCTHSAASPHSSSEPGSPLDKAMPFFFSSHAGPGYSVTIMFAGLWDYALLGCATCVYSFQCPSFVTGRSLHRSGRGNTRLTRALRVLRGDASVKDKKREDAWSVLVWYRD
jgi:hypothetical protein